MGWLLLGILAALALAGLALFFLVFVPWALRWGATPEECAAPLTGDDWLTEGDFRPARAVRATRAISIAAPPDVVWRWLAQIGRGAGYYAFDRVDNGGRPSAEHLVSWVTPPRVGDATAIGYLREVTTGRELAWWMPVEKLPGCEARMSVVYAIAPEGSGTRLRMRVLADGRGWALPLVLNGFLLVDTLMARRQLRGIRRRAERHGARPADPQRPETGARDQFQLYEFVTADGQRGGVPGKEKAAHWHELAKRELGERMGTAA